MENDDDFSGGKGRTRRSASSRRRGRRGNHGRGRREEFGPFGVGGVGMAPTQLSPLGLAPADGANPFADPRAMLAAFAMHGQPPVPPSQQAHHPPHAAGAPSARDQQQRPTYEHYLQKSHDARDHAQAQYQNYLLQQLLLKHNGPTTPHGTTAAPPMPPLPMTPTCHHQQTPLRPQPHAAAFATGGCWVGTASSSTASAPPQPWRGADSAAAAATLTPDAHLGDAHRGVTSYQQQPASQLDYYHNASGAGAGGSAAALGDGDGGGPPPQSLTPSSVTETAGAAGAPLLLVAPRAVNDFGALWLSDDDHEGGGARRRGFDGAGYLYGGYARSESDDASDDDDAASAATASGSCGAATSSASSTSSGAGHAQHPQCYLLPNVVNSSSSAVLTAGAASAHPAAPPTAAWPAIGAIGDEHDGASSAAAAADAPRERARSSGESSYDDNEYEADDRSWVFDDEDASTASLPSLCDSVGNADSLASATAYYGSGGCASSGGAAGASAPDATSAAAAAKACDEQSVCRQLWGADGGLGHGHGDELTACRAGAAAGDGAAQPPPPDSCRGSIEDGDLTSTGAGAAVSPPRPPALHAAAMAPAAAAWPSMLFTTPPLAHAPPAW